MRLWGYKAWNIPTLPLTGMVGILFYLTQCINCPLRTSFRRVYINHWTSLIYTEPRICIPRICANPCSSVGGYISPCALRRNLINLWPRLSCAFSQFSEINCHTLSLATLNRYVNSQFMNLVMRRCRYPFLLADRPFPARGSVLTQMRSRCKSDTK